MKGATGDENVTLGVHDVAGESQVQRGISVVHGSLGRRADLVSEVVQEDDMFGLAHRASRLLV